VFHLCFSLLVVSHKFSWSSFSVFFFDKKYDRQKNKIPENRFIQYENDCASGEKKNDLLF
jgi:hypothetical protein